MKNEELVQIVVDSGVTYAKIGNYLKIRSQNIGHWVMFKRPIPKKHYVELSEFLLKDLKLRRKITSKTINKLTNYLEEKCKTN